MSRHLKNIIIDRLKSTYAIFVQLPTGSTPHTRGVRYFETVEGINCIRGAVDYVREGQARRKRIVARPSRFRKGLHELYTFHFPKHWSAACVANRELIKEAQRQAHALERDHSLAALEWRVRFLHHYYRVFKGGEKPEPGMKAYSRFYQYTYVAIYRELKAEQEKAEEPQATNAQSFLSVGESWGDAVTFEPIVPEKLFRPHHHQEKNILDLAFAPRNELYFPPPNIENCK